MRNFVGKPSQAPKGAAAPQAGPAKRASAQGQPPAAALAEGHSFGRIPVTAPGKAGRPLEAAIRAPLESFFRQPLDGVKVFSDPGSRGAAESLSAYALTLGQNIHLGAAGEALPGHRRQALLAHEVVHTLQQRHAPPAPPAPDAGALSPEPQDSPQERQAAEAAGAFVAAERGGLAGREGLPLRPLASSRPQLARQGTNFGEFEDYKFNEVKNAAGDSVGVQLYLKFHPGANVDAKKIGLTQAAEGKVAGVQDTQGFRGRREATSGAGVGYFVDRVSERPSPLYGTTGTATAGADANTLGAYAAPGIHALSAAQRASLPLTGIDYGGGSVFGYRYMENGVLKGPVPAEMHDSPALPNANSSEQVFETAALAFEGTMAGTYLGSVEWGWRRDAAGAFSTIPLATKSRGVPSVNFLTAASIWNTAKESYGLLSNVAPTSVLKADLSLDFTVAKGTPLTQTGQGTAGGNTYYQVNVADGTGRSGFVLSTDTAQGDFGRDLVALPVPEIYTVNRAGGVVLDGETLCRPTDPTLPSGTRLRILGPYAGAPGYVRVEVVDGALTGRRGILRQSDLSRETLGTH